MTKQEILRQVKKNPGILDDDIGERFNALAKKEGEARQRELCCEMGIP